MKKIFWTILLIAGISQQVASQKPDLKFKHLTAAHGLSQTHVIYLAQDHKGFIWIGTQNGLNKYDGYKVSVYKYNSRDSLSISSNDIRYIYEDRNNNLWVGTATGLNLYDRNNDYFTTLLLPERAEYPNSDYINVIYEDNEGNLWIGTGEGIRIYNPENKTFTTYVHEPDNPQSLSSNSITSFYEDKNGNMWIGTTNKLNFFDRKKGTIRRFKKQPGNKGLNNNDVPDILISRGGDLMVATHGGGLNVYNFENETFTYYRHDPDDETSISNDVVVRLFEDSRGDIWAGTLNAGLNLFDPVAGTFTRYKNDIYDPQSILNNTISVIGEDISGNLWFGTHNGGVSFCHPYQWNFRQYKREIGKNSLSHNNVRSVIEDHNGDIWIGTDGGGLNKWDRKSKSFLHYRHNPDINSLSSDIVLSVFEDSDKNLWLGTYLEGLNKFDIKSNTFTLYEHDPADPESISSNTVWDVVEDDLRNLWFTTRDGGVSMLDRATNKFIRYLSNANDTTTLSNNWTICLLKDSESNIWVGTYGGLNLFNRETNTFTRFLYDKTNPDGISHDQINDLFEDSKGNLWIATPNGLNLFNRQTKTFSAFHQQDGLPSELILSIEEDDNRLLWISTLMHLSSFDPETKTFKNYLMKEEIQGNEFLPNVSLKTSDGEIIFGGLYGFNIFHPDSIRDNSFIPPVYFTDFQIFNKEVGIGPDSPLKQHINETKQITLSHRESVFSFEFAALNYIASEKNQYAYMMEGFDSEWNYGGTRRTATYTNLDPGEYTFRVKASNNDGIWNEDGASIKITIIPPFWSTWWFRILVVLLGIGIISAWYSIKINAIKKQKNVIENQVKERTAEVVAQKEKLALQTESLQKAHLELERVYEEVKDSIKAAQLIQSSILPSSEAIGGFLPEHFILYKPKDVVSGDFYWFDVVQDQAVVAAVDCTGHGVSGAFMSFNGHHLLNNSIYSYKELVASEILDRLNCSLIQELHQDRSEINDGMDIALCIIDKRNLKLQFAGANNPLYILRDNKIIRVEATRRPIGLTIGRNANKKFENNVIDLRHNDILYIFSDGYADQIGGEYGRKFMYPQFRELLIKTAQKDMGQQLIDMQETLNKWKGEHEQLDDILVMGFKIP